MSSVDRNLYQQIDKIEEQYIFIQNRLRQEHNFFTERSMEPYLCQVNKILTAFKEVINAKLKTCNEQNECILQYKDRKHNINIDKKALAVEKSVLVQHINIITHMRNQLEITESYIQEKITNFIAYNPLNYIGTITLITGFLQRFVHDIKHVREKIEQQTQLYPTSYYNQFLFLKKEEMNQVIKACNRSVDAINQKIERVSIGVAATHIAALSQSLNYWKGMLGDNDELAEKKIVHLVQIDNKRDSIINAIKAQGDLKNISEAVKDLFNQTHNLYNVNDDEENDCIDQFMELCEYVETEEDINKILKLLEDRSIDVSSFNALDAGVVECSDRIAFKLLEMGAQVNLKGAEGHDSSPLTDACLYKQEELALALIEKGADIYFQRINYDVDKETKENLLEFAVDLGLKQVEAAILERMKKDHLANILSQPLSSRTQDLFRKSLL